MPKGSPFKQSLPVGKRTTPPPQRPPGPPGEPPPPGVGIGAPAPDLGPPRDRDIPVSSRLFEIRFFLRYLKPLKWLVVCTLLAGLFVHIFRLPLMLIPTVLARAMDSPDPDKTPIYQFLGLVMLCLFIMACLTLLRGYLGIRLGENLLWTIRRDVYQRLERLSMLSVFARGAGQFVQRLTRDVYMIRDLFSETFVQIIDESSRGLVCAIACFIIYPALTGILLVTFLVVWPIVRWINNQVEKNAKTMLRISENIISNLVESVSGFRDILAAGKFESFASRFRNLLDQSRRYGVRTGIWGQFSGLVPQTIISYLIVAAYWFGTSQRLQTAGDVGLLITYMMYLQQVLPVFGILAIATSEVALATPSLREVRMLLEPGGFAPAPSKSTTPLAKVESPIESIRFENVTLVLDGRPIVENLNFEIPGGKMTAIIGQSGAGKTTLFNLLLRLIEPTSGMIWINESPLPEIDDRELRRILGIIPQNPFIFAQSLRENLLMAEVHDGREAALREAIEFAQLGEVIERRTPEGGLDADAGYMGSKLSGGEKQRIALGRLLIQNPEIIICDEYTANIDVKTARLIQETMRTRFADRTRIIITHELYATKGADHIIVLDRGRVDGVGVHETLVDRPGLYRDLWEVQQLEEERINGKRQP